MVLAGSADSYARLPATEAPADAPRCQPRDAPSRTISTSEQAPPRQTDRHRTDIRTGKVGLGRGYYRAVVRLPERGRGAGAGERVNERRRRSRREGGGSCLPLSAAVVGREQRREGGEPERSRDKERRGGRRRELARACSVE
jgi:hypothetical protein